MNRIQIRESPYSKNEYSYKKFNTKSGQKFLENIKKLYQNSKSNQKSNILTIVSSLFSRKYLNKMDFVRHKRFTKPQKENQETKNFI